jgi:hypothetical protein
VRLVAFVLPCLALGCGSASPSGGADAAEQACAKDLPKSCPSVVPSYRSDIIPLLSSSCIGCHSPTGIGGYSETTYEDVFQQRSAILDQVYDCLMPPANSGPLTTQQRETLLAWLVCGAPDN